MFGMCHVGHVDLVLEQEAADAHQRQVHLHESVDFVRQVHERKAQHVENGERDDGPLRIEHVILVDQNEHGERDGGEQERTESGRHRAHQREHPQQKQVMRLLLAYSVYDVDERDLPAVEFDHL